MVAVYWVTNCGVSDHHCEPATAANGVSSVIAVYWVTNCGMLSHQRQNGHCGKLGQHCGLLGHLVSNSL